MAVMIDCFEKEESINCGEKISRTIEPITVTITLAEYRSLVVENEMCKCDALRLNEENNKLKNEIADLQLKYEGMQQKYYNLQSEKSECKPISQTASVPKKRCVE